jgi:hypothetical protein
MAHFLPSLPNLPAILETDVFNQCTFTAGPQLEGQTYDAEISPRHATSSVQKHALSTSLECGEEKTLDRHGIYWPIPTKMLVAFALGIVAAGAHSAWYGHLNAKIVKSSELQENNMRLVLTREQI